MRVLAVLPESLGDFLLTTPSLRSLENHLGADQVAWLLPQKLREASRLVPLRAKRVFEEPQSFFHPAKIRRRLEEAPDQVVVFPPATRAYWKAARLGGKERVGYVHEAMWVPRLVSRWCLTRRWVCPRSFEIHELEAYGKILGLMGVPFEPSPPVCSVSSEMMDRAVDWLKTQGVAYPRRMVSVHLGSRWPENPLLFLEKWVGRELDTVLLALFSREEEPVGGAYVKQFRQANLLAPGPLPLAEYAAFLKLSSLLIAVDGGPVHLASGLGTPVTACYPEDNFQVRVARWHPYGVPHRALPLSREGLTQVSEAVQSLLPSHAT